MNVIFRANSFQYMLGSNSSTHACRLITNAFVQRNVCKQFNIFKLNTSRNINNMAGQDPGENNDQKTERQTIMIVGLGNHDLPTTRHSVGMMFVDKLAKMLGCTLSKNQDCLGFIGVKELTTLKAVLLKPKLAMNINGTSVKKTANVFQVQPQNIYLVHDDLDKDVGKIGLKEKGSASGHNGVKSVINSFKTDEIPRLRIGIGRPHCVDLVPTYVLKKFMPSELADIDLALQLGVDKLDDHLMSRFGHTGMRVLRTKS